MQGGVGQLKRVRARAQSVGENMARSFVAAITALSLAAFGGAEAATLDFTADGPSALGGAALSGSIAGTTYSVSNMGGALTNPSGAGATCSILSSLACDRDGLGVGDDEITGPSTVQSGESITVDFGASVVLAGMHLLDLFSNNDGESGTITTAAGVLQFFASEASGGGNSGYHFEALNILTDFITFTGDAGSGDDGSNDYAIAALDVREVPVPGAAFLMLSGIAGFVFASRKNRKKR